MATIRTEQQWRSAILHATSNSRPLTGRVYKSNRFWLAEIPSLDVMTQGITEEDAYDMVKDLLETLVNLPEFRVQVDPYDNGNFRVLALELA